MIKQLSINIICKVRWEYVKETCHVYFNILLIMNQHSINYESYVHKVRYEIYQLVESLQISVLIINHHL